ncbi:hypothetical protein [Nocardia sp. NPDC052566]|uniref:hypothetical protein n=1 Tax=Nocardia sp. NPDC052566 TaxID=3364330 RepID=UPI0037C6EB67
MLAIEIAEAWLWPPTAVINEIAAIAATRAFVQKVGQRFLDVIRSIPVIGNQLGKFLKFVVKDFRTFAPETGKAVGAAAGKAAGRLKPGATDALKAAVGDTAAFSISKSLHEFSEFLFKKGINMAMWGVGQDLLVQGIQMTKGHRDELAWNEIGLTALTSVVGPIVAHMPTNQLQKYIGGQFVLRGYDPTRGLAGMATGVPVAITTNILSGATGGTINGLITGNWDMGLGLAGGAIAGTITGAQRGYIGERGAAPGAKPHFDAMKADVSRVVGDEAPPSSSKGAPDHPNTSQGAKTSAHTDATANQHANTNQHASTGEHPNTSNGSQHPNAAPTGQHPSGSPAAQHSSAPPQHPTAPPQHSGAPGQHSGAPPQHPNASNAAKNSHTGSASTEPHRSTDSRSREDAGTTKTPTRPLPEAHSSDRTPQQVPAKGQAHQQEPAKPAAHTGQSEATPSNGARAAHDPAQDPTLGVHATSTGTEVPPASSTKHAEELIPAHPDDVTDTGRLHEESAAPKQPHLDERPVDGEQSAAPLPGAHQESSTPFWDRLPAGYEWKSMPRDGDCFFHVLDRLLMPGGEQVRTGPAYQARLNKMRSDLVAEIRNNRDRYLNNYNFDRTPAQLAEYNSASVDRLEQLDAQHDVTRRAQFNAQLDRLAIPRQWAVDVADSLPAAAARVFNVEFELRGPNVGIEHVVPPGSATNSVAASSTPGREIPLVKVEGEHYHLAVRADPEVGAAPVQGRPQIKTEHTDVVTPPAETSKTDQSAPPPPPPPPSSSSTHSAEAPVRNDAVQAPPPKPSTETRAQMDARHAEEVAAAKKADAAARKNSTRLDDWNPRAHEETTRTRHQYELQDLAQTKIQEKQAQYDTAKRIRAEFSERTEAHVDQQAAPHNSPDTAGTSSERSTKAEVDAAASKAQLEVTQKTERLQSVAQSGRADEIRSAKLDVTAAEGVQKRAEVNKTEFYARQADELVARAKAEPENTPQRLRVLEQEAAAEHARAAQAKADLVAHEAQVTADRVGSKAMRVKAELARGAADVLRDRAIASDRDVATAKAEQAHADAARNRPNDAEALAKTQAELDTAKAEAAAAHADADVKRAEIAEKQHNSPQSRIIAEDARATSKVRQAELEVVRARADSPDALKVAEAKLDAARAEATAQRAEAIARWHGTTDAKSDALRLRADAVHERAVAQLASAADSLRRSPDNSILQRQKKIAEHELKAAAADRDAVLHETAAAKAAEPSASAAELWTAPAKAAVKYAWEVLTKPGPGTPGLKYPWEATARPPVERTTSWSDVVQARKDKSEANRYAAEAEPALRDQRDLAAAKRTEADAARAAASVERAALKVEQANQELVRANEAVAQAKQRLDLATDARRSEAQKDLGNAKAAAAQAKRELDSAQDRRGEAEGWRKRFDDVARKPGDDAGAHQEPAKRTADGAADTEKPAGHTSSDDTVTQTPRPEADGTPPTTAEVKAAKDRSLAEWDAAMKAAVAKRNELNSDLDVLEHFDTLVAERHQDLPPKMKSALDEYDSASSALDRLKLEHGDVRGRLDAAEDAVRTKQAQLSLSEDVLRLRSNEVGEKQLALHDARRALAEREAELLRAVAPIKAALHEALSEMGRAGKDIAEDFAPNAPINHIEVLVRQAAEGRVEAGEMVTSLRQGEETAQNHKNTLEANTPLADRAQSAPLKAAQDRLDAVRHQRELAEGRQAKLEERERELRQRQPDLEPLTKRVADATDDVTKRTQELKQARLDEKQARAEKADREKDLKSATDEHTTARENVKTLDHAKDVFELAELRVKNEHGKLTDEYLRMKTELTDQAAAVRRLETSGDKPFGTGLHEDLVKIHESGKVVEERHNELRRREEAEGAQKLAKAEADLARASAEPPAESSAAKQQQEKRIDALQKAVDDQKAANEQHKQRAADEQSARAERRQRLEDNIRELIERETHLRDDRRDHAKASGLDRVEAVMAEIKARAELAQAMKDARFERQLRDGVDMSGRVRAKKIKLPVVFPQYFTAQWAPDDGFWTDPDSYEDAHRLSQSPAKPSKPARPKPPTLIEPALRPPGSARPPVAVP